MYHYTAIFKNQVECKNRAYAQRKWKGKSEYVDEYLKNWASLKDPFHLHIQHKYYTWIEKFAGIHPQKVNQMRNDIRSGKIAAEMRDNTDVKRLLFSHRYRIKKIYIYFWEYIKSRIAWSFSLLRKNQ